MKKKISTLLTLLVALAMVMTMNISAFAGSAVSKDEALNIALKNAGLKKSQVKRIDIDHDSEDGTYEVDFTRKNKGTEYDYEIDDESGTVLEKSLEYKYKKNTSHKKIGKKAARKKVAKYSGVSYKIIKEGTCKYKYSGHKGIYKIKFTYNNRKYECEVLAPTGKIIEYEWELINR